tara:strand:- start:191 stop:1381 length:1191 start_codon:yes stop_codon:yes gene_type:complete
MKKDFLNLGRQPIANSFLSSISKKSLKSEYFYNLIISFNTKNFLVSVKKPVNPKIQYTDKYAHRASESQTMRNAFRSAALKLYKRFKPKKIMEIGSNDGVFLKNFPRQKVVGVEPCKNLAEITKKKFKTYPNFWNKILSKKILEKHSKVDLIFSANTISHIPNLKETFEAIFNIISDDGVFVIEDPSLSSVIKINSYDQFYDEHVYVFSTLAVENIVKKYKLRLFDVEKINTHGGSLRYFICKNDSNHKKTKRLVSILNEEKKIGLDNFNTFKKFAKRVKNSKKKLVSLLKKIKKNNNKIISYGATYKSTTVFNYCKIDTRYIHYVTDTTFNKQGKFTPGTHIPIISPEIGFNESVDYAFLGAWNFKREILNKEKKYIKRGGKFITHVPEVKILGK